MRHGLTLELTRLFFTVWLYSKKPTGVNKVNKFQGEQRKGKKEMVKKGRASRVVRDPKKDYYADPARVRLGSRPFKGGIIYYIVRNEAYISKSTIEENARKLYYFADVLLDLKQEGKVKTTDPRHMKRQEIEAFMVWIRRQDLQVSTRKKYISILDTFLRFWGNNIVQEMKRRRELNPILRGQENDIKYIEFEDLQKIFDCIRSWPGYDGIILRGYISLIFSVAGRPKEIIDALVGDVNTEDWLYYVRHPKGEGSWGKREWVPIVRADMHPLIARFLAERKAYLTSRGVRSRYLFVNPETEIPYSLKHMRQLKHEVELATGVDFMLKEFRATYATITYAYSPEMSGAISKHMRHGDESNTRKYYIAYSNKQAADRLRDEWKKSSIK